MGCKLGFWEPHLVLSGTIGQTGPMGKTSWKRRCDSGPGADVVFSHTTEQSTQF